MQVAGRKARARECNLDLFARVTSITLSAGSANLRLTPSSPQARRSAFLLREQPTGLTLRQRAYARNAG
jgi:hypothetical protein